MHVCLLNKPRKGREHGVLGHFDPATEPYQIMSLDTIGELGSRRSSKNYIHLSENHFTRYAFILTSTNQNAAEFIRLIDSVHKEHPMKTLLTAQYGGFASKESHDYLKISKIIHCYTAVDSPT